MTRRRSAAQPAPRSTAEAIPLLERYGVISATIDLINADRDEQVALANGSADQAIAPLEVEAKSIFAQLKTWWAVSANDVTGGKQRSTKLGGCELGYRLTPPKLTHTHGKDGEAAIALRATSYGLQLTEVSYKLDKAAIMRRLGEEAEAKALARAEAEAGVGHNGGPALDGADDGAAEPAKDLEAMGFASKQTDEFFVAPIPAATPAASGRSTAPAEG